MGYPVAWEWSTRENIGDVAVLFDLICYPRQAWTDIDAAREFMNLSHKMGKIVISEHDDDVWISREDQKNHIELGYEDRPEASPEQNKESLLLLDGTTVSTRRLAQTIGTFSSTFPVQVVGNYIDLEWWRMMTSGWKREVPKDIVTVGWAGGNRYDTDVTSVAEAWSNIANKYDDVGFVIQGYQPEVLVNAVPADRLYQVEFLPLTGASDKPCYAVGLLNIDIGCASVAPTLFNAAKTPIKLWEYTASGAACVGSRWLYGPYIDSGKTGLIAETADEWTQAIGTLIERPSLRGKLQKRMMVNVRTNYNLEDNAWRWYDAWQKLYNLGKFRLQNGLATT